MTPFEKWIVIATIVAFIIGCILKQLLPHHIWEPIHTGVGVLGGAIATGAVSNVNIGRPFSTPYAEQSIQAQLRTGIHNYGSSISSSQPGRRLRLIRNDNVQRKFHRRKKKHRFTPAQKRLIASLQDWNCGWCGNPLPSEVAFFDIDHIIPWHLDPETLDYPNMSNLQAIHPIPCHRVKSLQERRNAR